MSDTLACATGTSKVAARSVQSTGGLASRLRGGELVSRDIEVGWSVAKWMPSWNALEGGGPERWSTSESEKGDPSLELEQSSVRVSSRTDCEGRKWYGVY